MAGINLAFTTPDDELRQLCCLYWHLGEEGFLYSVAELGKTFGLPRWKIPLTVTQCSVASCSDQACSCGTPRTLSSRADFERGRRSPTTPWICEVCLDTDQAKSRLEQEQRSRLGAALLQDELELTKAAGPYTNRASFADAVYLVSLLRAGGSEDLTFVVSRQSFQQPLTPTAELDREVLERLYSHGLICIHPNSSPDSLRIDDGVLTRFSHFDVQWIVPLPDDGPSPARFLEDAERALNSTSWPDNWREESEALHRTVALHECLQYLRVVLEEHGFYLRIGEKTCLILRSVLTHFSIGQTNSFIWRAVKDAAAFYVRRGTSAVHAANTVTGSIQRMAERALAEGWTIRPFRRDFRTPRSVLSQVLFTTALKLSEDGSMTMRPPLDEPTPAATFRRLAFAGARPGGVACVQCGTLQELYVAHSTPLSHGGSDQSADIRLLCGRCASEA